MISAFSDSLNKPRAEILSLFPSGKFCKPNSPSRGCVAVHKTAVLLPNSVNQFNTIVDSDTKAPFDVSSIKYLKYPKTLHKYELERELEIPLRKMVIASYEQYKSDKKVAFEALFTEIMLNSDELGLDTKQASKIDLIYEILTSKEEAEILYHQDFQYFRQRGIDRMREYIDENIENLVENMSSEQEIREELYGVLKQLRREETKLYPPIPIASIEREIQELIDNVQKKQDIFRLKNYELVK